VVAASSGGAARKGFGWEAAQAPTRRLLARVGFWGIRLELLDRAWERLQGHRKRHWDMTGIQRNIIEVEATSSAALQEFRMIQNSLLRDLNKEFPKPWIQGFKVMLRGARRSWSGPAPRGCDGEA